MSFYLDLKIAASDGVCALLDPVAPPLFARYCTRFIDGAFVTVELLTLCVLFGFVIAVPLALLRVDFGGLPGRLAAAYCYVFRGTPLLVQLWTLYFGLGALGEDGLGPLWPLFKDAYWVGLLTLSLHAGGYAAEIFRGGLANVPAGQIEAAKAYGMGYLETLIRIRGPQAFRLMWPSYANEIVLMMKASALVSTITVLDLMGQTRTVFSRSYDLTIFLYAAILYLILAGALTLSFRAVEKRLRARGG